MKILAEIAKAIDGVLNGPGELKISGIASLPSAKEDEIALVANAKFLKEALDSKAAAFIVPEGVEVKKPCITVKRPHTAFAKALNLFYSKVYAPGGVSQDAKIGKNVKLGKDVTIYPFVYIHDEAQIGDRVTLFPFVFIGSNTKIGDDTLIYPNVSIYKDISVGKRCILHAGVVLGADGFGYVQEEGKHNKIPQVGKIIVEDDVEIGANTCIDRATLDETILGAGTKIDNLVQVAHNVRIGKNCILVAQAGVAGSSKLGDGAILAAQAGISDHVSVGENSIVIAQAGVIKDVAPKSVVSLTPAMPHNVAKRVAISLPQLPEILKELQGLKRRIEELESK
ncbi:MAG: UDP-3-O-(3-hydroxymyristoyl)glucosamine N-acyltransferase [Candidatus Omnitrophota bacterium]